MRLSAISTLLASASLALAIPQTVQIYIQPIHTTNPSPLALAEISYDTTSPTSTASVLSYEAPLLPQDFSTSSSTTNLVRIGVYDTALAKWTSSTTVAAASNFGKGYSPHFVVSLAASTSGEGNGDEKVAGEVLSVACRGVKIDAGYTRDFGPQVVIVEGRLGKQPDLNKPVVLTPEGKKAEEPVEKSFIQKYWWIGAVGLMILITTGGEAK